MSRCSEECLCRAGALAEIGSSGGSQSPVRGPPAWSQVIVCARRRRALPMTLTLDKAMAAAATIGESRTSKTG